MKCHCKIPTVVLVLSALTWSLSSSCGEDTEEAGSDDHHKGNHRDLTGRLRQVCNLRCTLGDLVRYHSDEGLIPGDVKLKVASGDTHWDSARTIPGYNWLRGGQNWIFLVIEQRLGGTQLERALLAAK
jgi:hypothetical protein